MRAPDYTRPSVHRPSQDDSAFQSTTAWQPYPNLEPSVKTDFGKFAHIQYDLHEIGADVASFVFGEPENPASVFHELDQRLAALSQKIPWSDEGATLNPHIMDLKYVPFILKLYYKSNIRSLFYHWIRITLFNFLKSSAIAPDSSPEERERLARFAREQCITSAQITAKLHGRYIHDYGSRNLTIWMPQTAISTAYMLIDDLDKPEVQDIFHDVCLVLASVSRRWYVMRGQARMLYITVEQAGKPMADRTRQILGRVALDLWKPNDHKTYDGSVYPNYALAKVEDPRAAGMGELLDLWANATLQADASMPTPSGGDSDGFLSTSSGRDMSDRMSIS